MFKKITLTVAVLSLTLALAGCGSKPAPQPTPNQPPATSQLPAGHPSTSGQSAASVPKYDQAQVEAKVNDVLKNYPGDWKLSGTTLSKGSYTENKNYKIVDDIANAFGGTAMVSMFVGTDATRISSTVRQGDFTSYPAPPEAAQVIKSGKAISSSAAGMGGTGTYLKVFIPIKSGNSTVGVMLIDVPQS